MFTSRFRVALEQSDGTHRLTEVTADQRDLAQLELQEWHGTGKRAVVLGLRHLVFTALVRGATPEVKGTSWEQFNTRTCVWVESLDEPDDDDDAADADPNASGQSTTSGGS